MSNTQTVSLNTLFSAPHQILSQQLILGLNMNPRVHLIHLGENLVFLSSIVFYSNHNTQGSLLIYFRHSLNHYSDYPHHLHFIITYEDNLLINYINHPQNFTQISPKIEFKGLVRQTEPKRLTESTTRTHHQHLIRQTDFFRSTGSGPASSFSREPDR